MKVVGVLCAFFLSKRRSIIIIIIIIIIERDLFAVRRLRLAVRSFISSPVVFDCLSVCCGEMINNLGEVRRWLLQGIYSS
jgi:hypothetical protein